MAVREEPTSVGLPENWKNGFATTSLWSALARLIPALAYPGPDGGSGVYVHINS
jgi:hypothetical protein